MVSNFISYAFMRALPKDLGVFLANVIQKMEDNDLFIPFKTEVAALKTLHTPFWTAYNNALIGGKDRIDERNVRLQALLPQALKVARLVEANAGSDTAIILAAGFELRKSSTTAAPKLSMPSNLTVKKGEKSGSVDVAWTNEGGSISFDIESLLKGDTEWKNAKHTTKTSITMLGYEPGTYVDFHVCSNGKGESTSDWTTAVGIWIN